MHKLTELAFNVYCQARCINSTGLKGMTHEEALAWSNVCEAIELEVMMAIKRAQPELPPQTEPPKLEPKGVNPFSDALKIESLEHALKMLALEMGTQALAADDFKNAAEMLWIVLANVSNGDWGKQDEGWREADRRWADNYHNLCSKYKLKTA